MKRIISAFIVTLMLVASVMAMIPVNAAEVVGTYTPDWAQLKTDLQYIAYDADGNAYDLVKYHSELPTKRETNLLSASRKAKGPQVSYISKIYFKITSTTKYQYDVMVKTHQDKKYAGVAFAISTDNKVYFLYGAYNNKCDIDDNASYAIGAHGSYTDKCTSQDDQANPKFTQVLKLDSDGFATLRFVYEGLTVTVMGMNKAGEYVQIGDQIPLESGSKVALGLYSRDGDTSNNRTLAIKNAVVSGLNAEAVNYMKATGVTVVTSEVESPEQPGEFDSTELEAVIAEAEELDGTLYTKVSYGMIPKAVEEAKELLATGTATQSEIDAMTAKIRGRIDQLVLLDNPPVSDDEESVEVDTETESDNATDTSATDAPIVQQPIVQQPVVQPTATQNAVELGRGCGASVAATAVVLGIVATLGTTLVIKKKD